MRIMSGVVGWILVSVVYCSNDNYIFIMSIINCFFYDLVFIVII